MVDFQLLKVEQSKNFFADAFNQPFFDPAGNTFYQVCKEASRDFKVLIGGDGGDEIFAGYPNLHRPGTSKIVHAKRLLFPFVDLLGKHDWVFDYEIRTAS